MIIIKELYYEKGEIKQLEEEIKILEDLAQKEFYGKKKAAYEELIRAKKAQIIKINSEKCI